ncbi:tyrosine-type recombinase/integrase [Streptomyces sp. NPDC058947]|uniref:tyrosine-type recombinase/integrase n=1 Tax=Streptomyces sp. NPDC058947 TaxID=3346675 RepID=UPI0036974FCB
MTFVAPTSQTRQLVHGSAEETVLTWLRDTLGTVAPRDPRTRRLGERRYRLELLAELCDQETFSLAASWLGSEAVRSVKSKQDYADDLRYWANCVRELTKQERLSWASVTPELIEVWTKIQRANGVKPRTMNRRMSSWSSFIQFVAWKRKDRNIVTPVSRYDRPYVDPHDEDTATPILEKRELHLIIEAAETAEEVLAVVLVYTLAGRATECCTALRTHLFSTPTDDGVQHWIKLVRKRGKKPDWPLPQKLWDLIQLVAARHPNSLTVLVDSEGRPMDRHAIDRLLTRLGRKAGVLPGRELTPHVLRASRLTHMHDEGKRLQVIRDYADHASSDTTLRYILRREASKNRAELAEEAVDVYANLTVRFLGESPAI